MRRLHLLLTALAVALLGLPAATPAQALEAPVAFTAAHLATHQTNGVVWTVASSSGLVFVGGTFTALRPPGASAGTSETARTNFAVLNAATGAPTSCAPSFTIPSTPSAAIVRTLDVSPDGRTLYVGGYFSTVAGTPRQHLAALDISSCTLISGFAPNPTGAVHVARSTADAVYYGGLFSGAGGVSRRNAAAAGAVGTASSGKVLAWAPEPDNVVRAVALKPDNSVVVLGGKFDLVRGVDSHALAVVDAGEGNLVKAYPLGFVEKESAVQDVVVDSTGFYTAHEGTGPGRFDGRIALDWDYKQRWRDTCFGATQALVLRDGVLYSGSHAHNCSGIGAFADGARWHLLAQRTTDPTLLPWFPNTNDGIGEKIGPRDLALANSGSSTYLYVVGEFTTVNGAAQQGITRFGQGPAQIAPSPPTMSLSSPAPGTVRVAWRQSFDRDDSTLTYRVFRDGSSTPLHESNGTSWFWQRRQMTFTDTGLTDGATHSYRVEVTDGIAKATGSAQSVQVGSGRSAYAERVLADGATFLWRYDEPSGALAADASIADNNGTVNGPAGYRTVPAALADDPSTALTTTGPQTTIYSETQYGAQPAYSLETWIKTTTTTGGKIIGFGNKQVYPSTTSDKHVYMTNTGRLVFGVNSSGAKTITSSASYNDGAWHHVVARQGTGGMALYVDGVSVGSNGVTTNQSYLGYWRVGGDDVTSFWPNRPTSDYFSGSLDETAVYSTALSGTTIAAHHKLGREGGTSTPPPAGDSTAPSVPSDVRASVSGSSVAVTWVASTDQVGVTGYEVHRSGSSGFTPGSATLVGSPSGTSFTESSVPAGTWYYRVVARDAAGNRSAPSSQVGAVVESAPPPPPPSGGTVQTISPSADAYANEGAPSANYGSSGSLTSRGSLGAVSYLRFAVPAAPAGTTLTGATLQLRTSGESFAGSAESHTVSFADDSWSESTLSWSNRPALSGSALGTLPAGSVPNTAYEVALDPAALATLVGRQGTLAMTNTGTDSLWFSSNDSSNTSWRPTLVLTYGEGGTPPPAGDSTAPSVPSDVRASVSGSSVAVTWVASTDQVGVTGYEVHRSGSSGFTPGSATLVGSPSGTSFTESSVPAGTWYYRVVARDAAGNRSAPSSQVGAVVESAPPPPPPSGGTVQTISPSADAYANEGAPSANYGSSGSLTSRGSLGAVSYLRFAVPAAPAGTTLTGATLQLRTSGESFAGSAESHTVSFADDSWSESTLSWSNRPALSGSALGTLPAGSVPNTAYEVALDPAALATLVGRQGTLAMTNTGTDSLWFSSNDSSNTSWRPTLVLTYGEGGTPPPAGDSTAPSVPSDVRASVSGSSVAVTWVASTDEVGVTGYEVHRSGSSGFTPGSATLVGSPSGTSFTESSVPAGTWYYRVVARDAAGNRSAPSSQVGAVVESAPPPPPPSGGTVQTISPSADAYANEGAPSANYGSSGSLTSRGSLGAVSYLRFAVPAAPAGTTLTGATLQLRTSGESFAGSAESHTVSFADDSWSESTLSWSNRPALSGSALGTLPAGSVPNTAYEVALDPAALATLVGRQGTLAMTNTGTDSLWFSSNDSSNTSWRPTLVLTWS